MKQTVISVLMLFAIGFTAPSQAQLAGTTWVVVLIDFSNEIDCWHFNADGTFNSDILTINFGFPPGQWHESFDATVSAFQSDFTGQGGSFDFTSSAGGLFVKDAMLGAFVESDTNRSQFVAFPSPNCTLPVNPTSGSAEGAAGPD